jgi:3'(2'), 5'-bisphosphate nucleotidase
MSYQKELNAAIEAAIKAKKTVLDYYHNGFHVEIKSDKSPVTEADKASDKIIRDYLKERFPSYSFLTEESVDDKKRLENDYVWIIDPVDGTEDFVHKDGQFTINIALAYKHKPVVGVVLIPVEDSIYYASEGDGAYKFENGISKRIYVDKKIEDLNIFTSKYHVTDGEKRLIEKLGNRVKNVVPLGSSIKACRIAEGLGELSFRTSDGTKEWDTCAFQAVVEEAGGAVLKFDGTPITYNRDDVYNRGGYIILNRIENFIK